METKVNVDYMAEDYLGSLVPLPIGFYREGEIIPEGRLRSTAGGGAWWWAGEAFEPFLSKAPYEPTIHVAFDGIVELLGARDVPDSYRRENVLLVGRTLGYEGRNIVLFARARGPVKDLSRRRSREAIIKVARQRVTYERMQGHLSIKHVDATTFYNTEGRLKVKHALRLSVPHLYNHEALADPLKKVAIWAVRYDLSLLVLPDDPERDYWIVSPDHKPVRVSGPVLLEHPVPDDD